MRMNPEIKGQLLEALESGKYNHGTDRLKKIDEEGVIRHCCLGVLCEIVNPHWQQNNMEFCNIDEYGYQKSTYLLPSVMTMCSLSDDDMRTLALINDASVDYKKQIEYIKEKL